MTEAMPFLQKTILLSYDPRSFAVGPFWCLQTRSPAQNIVAANWRCAILVYQLIVQ